jgi:ATP-dependent RNA helicase DeaD
MHSKHENAHATPHEHANTEKESKAESASESTTITFSHPVQQAVKDLGYTTWTPIQEMTIPLILAGKDVMGQSHTGSGKTAAFGLPIIEKMRPTGVVQALILVPTRELCEQVMQEMRKFSKHKRMSITAVYGGASMGLQIQHLRRTDVVVGTPGRVLDHIERGTLRLNAIHTLVLDEADRMLDMGFIQDMKKIIRLIPHERQTLLFSATFSHEVQQIAAQHMKHPQLVKAQTHVDKGKLEQIYYDLDKKADQKFGLLMHILKTEKPPLAMIFCGTRRNVDKIERNLNANGIKAEAIHGGLSQNQRKRTLQDFHSGRFHVLVASDVAARGLDIKNVSHIINYDISRAPADYIHRSGRTARAGEEGKIISLLAPTDYDYFRSIVRDKSHNIVEMPLPEFENIAFTNSKGKIISDQPSYGHKPMQRGHAQSFGNRREHFSKFSKPGNFAPRNRSPDHGEEKSFSQQEAAGQPYGARDRTPKSSFGNRKPFEKHASYGNKPTGAKPYGTKPFGKKPFGKPGMASGKNDKYGNQEFKIVKHFGLKHAKKTEE